MKLAREQAAALQERIGPMVSYLVRLRRSRMFETVKSRGQHSGRATCYLNPGSSDGAGVCTVPPAYSRTRRMVVAAALAVIAALIPVPTYAAERPRLVVLVYFDQLRADYLTRWADLYGDGGFRRLMADGAWFQDCHYPYAYTVTAAGHASVATGCPPSKHGIVGNDWYDRVAGTSVTSVSSVRYARVPPKTAPPPASDRPDPELHPVEIKVPGVSPERLLQPTLADALKDQTGGKGRVVALSLKNRSAVLPGGRRPDACYWLDTTTGEFVTSTYYRDRLHQWAAEYNRARPADQWAGKEWNRLRADLDYGRWSGPDDVAGEGKGAAGEEKGTAQGRVFPHPFHGGHGPPAKPYYAAVYNSPSGNDLLLGLAERAIDGERLGTRDTPDLLTISFSSNDAVGHCWGPDSQEVLDTTLRSDLIVKRLLDVLDAKVGRGRYVLALTADHGVCPLPEVSAANGRSAGRVSPDLLGVKAEEFLDEKFGAKAGVKWIEAKTGAWVYLNPKAAAARGLAAADVEAALAGWLRGRDGVQAAYTRTELLAGVPADDAVGQAVLKSFHAARCGDLIVILKPYYVMSSALATGTTHGTPHPYDTHVPLLVYGTGVRAGVRIERVSPLSTAAILSEAAGLKAPSGAETSVPSGLFEGDR